MQETTVSRILPLVAGELNLDPVSDRQQLLDEIFECESLMFSALGASVRQAFFVRGGCVPLVEFTQDCRSRCRGRYLGFSLPSGVEKAEVFRINGERVTISSQYSGPAHQWVCHERREFTGLDLGLGWSLPVDAPSPGELGFSLRTGGLKADPVIVGVTYFDLNGTLHREDVEVIPDTPTFTRRTVALLAKQGITISPGRCHPLEIWCGADHVLTEIHPSIDVPNFRRFAVTEPVCASVVQYEDALHVPVRPVFDTDLLPTGDPIFWRNILQWKALHFKTKRTAPEERAYASTGQVLLAQANSMLEIREPESFEVIIKPINPAREAISRFRQLGRRSWR